MTPDDDSACGAGDFRYYVQRSSGAAGEGSMEAWATQLRRGLVELAVLAALRRGEAHGYAVVERLAGSGGLAVTESTVYPLLSRLARDGFLLSRTEPSAAGPPRRLYWLSDAGRSRLELMTAHWGAVKSSVDRVLQGG